MNKPRNKDIIELAIHDLGSRGEGVGYYQGFTIFVEGALPGEVIKAKLFDVQKKYGRAELINILQTSPSRVKPPCPLFGSCGGCQIMHLSYDAQLERKRKKVNDALQRIGRIHDVTVSPCMPSPRQLNYRNKIQLPVKMVEGKLTIGLYSKGSHDLVEVNQCLIHCALGEKVFEAVSSIVKASDITAYDLISGQGDLRHIIIKSTFKTDENLVILVTNGEEIPVLNQITKRIMQRCPTVKGVIQNIHTEQKNVVLGDKYKLLAGSLYIHETICGLKFQISAASFFQVNPSQAEFFYQKALDFAELKGDEIVLDAYCGVGTLSLLFAQKAKMVKGVECVTDAIKDAQSNAQANMISNVEFVCDNAEDYIATLNHIDLILLNPTRRGCELSFLKGVGRLKPLKVIYISCDPATLARDLAILKQFGYSIDTVQPFDMFPQTSHVECVVKLTKRDN